MAVYLTTGINIYLDADNMVYEPFTDVYIFYKNGNRIGYFLKEYVKDIIFMPKGEINEAV